MQKTKLNPLPIAATFSKDPSFWGVDFEPQNIVHGDGAQVLGNDGHLYLDWVSGLGANLLGYNHREYVLRVSRQVGQGGGYSLPHFLEQQVAEKIVTLLGNHVPSWTPEGLGLRFGKTGTDATTMAVRLARAVTGRMRILSSGYHGWGDWSVSKTPPHWGVYEQGIDDIPFNNLLAIQEAFAKDSYAAIILEYPMQNATSGYFPELRKFCNKHGVLLILDEVVTGFRFALGGAAEMFNAEPDIACYGKALGNGQAISCMVGRREYFDWFSRNDPVFVSSTHFGNAVDLAAADAVLDIWDQEGVDHLGAIGAALIVGLRKSFGFPHDAGIDIIGHPARSLNQFSSKSERAYFTIGMRDRGILMNRPNIPNLAHSLADVAKTVKAATEVAGEMLRLGPDGLEAKMKDRLPRVLFEGR